MAESEQTAGNIKAALDDYEAGLTIMRPLVESHPADAVWRHDLAVAEGKEGAVRLTLGDAEGGTGDLHTAEGTLAALTAKDPRNVEWRKDWEQLRQRLASNHEALKGNSPSGP